MGPVADRGHQDSPLEHLNRNSRSLRDVLATKNLALKRGCVEPGHPRLLELFADVDGCAGIQDAVAPAQSTFGDDFHRLEVYDREVEGEGPWVFVIVGVDVCVALQVPINDLAAAVGEGIAFVVGVESDVVTGQLRFELTELLEPRRTAASTGTPVGDDPTALASEVEIAKVDALRASIELVVAVVVDQTLYRIKR